MRSGLTHSQCWYTALFPELLGELLGKRGGRCCKGGLYPFGCWPPISRATDTLLRSVPHSAKFALSIYDMAFCINRRLTRCF